MIYRIVNNLGYFFRGYHFLYKLSFSLENIISVRVDNFLRRIVYSLNMIWKISFPSNYNTLEYYFRSSIKYTEEDNCFLYNGLPLKSMVRSFLFRTRVMAEWIAGRLDLFFFGVRM